MLHSPQAGESEPGFWEPDNVQRWRALYRLILDTLEVERGISFHQHTLDGYSNPMGEDLLERIGAARASRAGS